MSKLPTRQEALELLEEHVKDDYQKHHARMVAACLEAYATKYDEDSELWYLTGLLHDLDYFEHPEEHPKKSLEWFKEWDYSEELIHAVAAHAMDEPRVEPDSKLAACLIAVDELTGFLYAYSLMRPTGWEGMKAKSVKKKFKDKAFAAKIDREEIMYGIEKLGVDFSEHVTFVIDILSKLK
jgi:putative nucleotidyltransferase with HDIG domain